MKKWLLYFFVAILVLTGCSSGISQEEYDELLAENEVLRQKITQYEAQLDMELGIGEYLHENNEEETTVISEIEKSIVEISSASESDFLYVNNGTEVQINGYLGDGGYVVIPTEIEGTTVTRIAANAFKKADNITGIVLPEKLQFIGDDAFWGLRNLTGVVVIPDTVIEVGGYAFQDTRLSGLVIKSSCEIGINAFANIYSLEFIYVAEKCAPKIGISVFGYAEALTTAVFPESMVEIRDENFKACNSMVIYTPEGSFAEEYANRNFIRVNSAGYAEQAAAFAAKYSKDITLEDEDTDNEMVHATEISPTIGTTKEKNPIVSITEETLQIVRNMTKYDLVKKEELNTVSYYYKGIKLQSDECKRLNASWNTEGNVNQDAIYNTLAKHLVGFGIGINNGSAYSELVIGHKTETKEEFEPYANVVSEFICVDDSLYHVLKKLETLESVRGTFDYKNDTFNIEISSLSKCSEEMMISEEMLGYIFGLLDCYAFEFDFEGDSCQISYEALFDFGWN